MIAWVRVASAEPSPLFAEGKQLLQDGKPAEACAKFEAALREQPEAPGILLNLGLCNAQQDKLATALKWFRRAQTRAAERAMAETESAAKLQTVALAAKVPTIKIEIAEPPPSDATVTVDGATIDLTSLARLEIDAGHHVVELHGSNLETSREPIDVRPDSTPDTVVTLHVVAARPTPRKATIMVEVDRGRPWRRGSYIVGGVGVGLLVAEAGLGLVGRKIFDDSHDLATRQRWKNIVRYGGTSMFGVGAAALGTAVVLYLAAPKKERVEQTVIAPFATEDRVGVAIGGSF
ncbi:MAG TPA: tetratricopeptide repeat protein [Kofleriaceae bacterium]